VLVPACELEAAPAYANFIFIRYDKSLLEFAVTQLSEVQPRNIEIEEIEQEAQKLLESEVHIM
jgi:DNA repair ATPase RecN